MCSDAPREPQILAHRPTPSGVELDLRIPSDLAALAGHFPGLAIVPGVVLLDWAALYAQRFLGRPDRSARQFQVKFRKIISPEAVVTLALHGRKDGRVHFEYQRTGTIYATGTIAPAQA